jgi:hypothetical protein
VPSTETKATPSIIASLTGLTILSVLIGHLLS